MSALVLAPPENELSVVAGEGNVTALSSNDQIPLGSFRRGTEDNAVAATGTRRSCKRSNLSQGSDWQIVDLPGDIAYVRSMPGKATDPHSIRERERRRTITEKMNYLKSIVPGCLEISQQLGVINHVIDYVKHLQEKVMDLSEQIAFSENLSTPCNPGINSIPAHTYSTSTFSGMTSRRPSQFPITPFQRQVGLLRGIPEDTQYP